MLKSRIHYRAGFKPIASHIVECAGEGVTNADLSVYPVPQAHAADLAARSDVAWRRPPLDPMPERDFHLLIDIGNTFLKWGLFQPSRRHARARIRARVGARAARGDPALPRQFAKLPAPAQHRHLERRRHARARRRRSACWRCGPTRRRRTGSCRSDAQCGVATVPQSRATRQRPLGGADRRTHAAGRATGDGGGVRHRDDHRFPDRRRRVQGRHDHAGRRPDAALAARGHGRLAGPGRRVHHYPTQTVDAIASGCQHAQAGAIERLHRDRSERARPTSGACCRAAPHAGRAASRFRSSSTRTSCSKGSTRSRSRCDRGESASTRPHPRSGRGSAFRARRAKVRSLAPRSGERAGVRGIRRPVTSLEPSVFWGPRPQPLPSKRVPRPLAPQMRKVGSCRRSTSSTKTTPGSSRCARRSPSIGLPFEEWFLSEGVLDLAGAPPQGVFYNRMSASSHTRGHRYAAGADRRRARVARVARPARDQQRPRAAARDQQGRAVRGARALRHPHAAHDRRGRARRDRRGRARACAAPSSPSTTARARVSACSCSRASTRSSATSTATRSRTRSTASR